MDGILSNTFWAHFSTVLSAKANFSSYIEAGDDSICYAKLDDSVITDDIKDDAIKTKGYFIYPSQLFCNVAAKANTNDRLNADLNSIFVAIESSAYGYPSEADIKGLFADFDTTSNRLGNTVKDKNARLAAVLKGVEGLKLGDFNEHQIDLFGDAYEFLISNYAANAGKSGGEFFTPQHVSKLIAQLAMHGQTNVNKIYDPQRVPAHCCCRRKNSLITISSKKAFSVRKSTIRPITWRV